MNDPPKFRSEHPSALKRRVMAERKKRLQHNEDAAPQHGYFCDLCGGKGWVVVPHLQCVVDGQWVPPYTTYAVCCMCSKGEQVADSYLERKEKQMKLGYYEGRNPGWHMQLSQRRQQAKLEAAAIEKGRLADANAEHMRDDPFKKALERIKGRDVHLNGQFDSFKNGKVGEE